MHSFAGQRRPMQSESSNVVWGEPQGDPAHWSGRKTLAAAGIAVALAGVGAAVIYAASGSSDGGSGFGGPGGRGGPGGSQGFEGPPGMDGAGGPPGLGGPPGMGGAGAEVEGAPGGALHGQFVVPDGKGGYLTDLVQTGQITELSDTSITVRSEDGFIATYVVTPETRQGREPLGVGDTATVRAGDLDKTARVISEG